MLEAILKVFTKEYKRETDYLEFKHMMRDKVKLRSCSYDADDRIATLINKGFRSNCTITIGEF